MTADEKVVLVVDDHDDTREVLSVFLETQGYRVEGAANGRQALQRLRAGVGPCLILLDLHMPEMDGFAFRREQQQDPALRSVPVIVFSGHHDAAGAARELGVADYFRKPIDFSELMEKVARYCPC